MRAIRCVDDVRRLAEVARVEGCKWFKLYDNVDPSIAREAVAYAHELGLKVTCHVTGIELLNVINMGFDMVEHVAHLPILEPMKPK